MTCLPCVCEWTRLSSAVLLCDVYRLSLEKWTGCDAPVTHSENWHLYFVLCPVLHMTTDLVVYNNTRVFYSLVGQTSQQAKSLVVDRNLFFSGVSRE